jgi:CMP-N,N'-diacetyllegionaminic acid synthase
VISEKRVLAVIPARGGSRGVARKNVRDLAGKPLIAWTIEEASRSQHIDRLILSSEDAEIMSIARTYGCEVPFTRPADLARDDTPGVMPVLHALEALPGYDIVVLLQTTSPMRTAADIDGCIEQLVESGAGACVSVTPAERSPYWMFTMDSRGIMEPLLRADSRAHRRQDLPSVYALNGAVYAAKCEWLLEHKTFVTPETVGFVMPQERSLDIDTELDLRIAQCIWSTNLNDRPD